MKTIQPICIHCCTQEEAGLLIYALLERKYNPTDFKQSYFLNQDSYFTIHKDKNVYYSSVCPSNIKSITFTKFMNRIQREVQKEEQIR